jgi:hypothetical protein
MEPGADMPPIVGVRLRRYVIVTGVSGAEGERPDR